MNNPTTIIKHTGLFLTALLISATAFAYDISVIETSMAAHKDFTASLEYLPKELLAWL